MKTNLLKTALLTASLLCAVGSASAETVHANIPFEFSANGKSMPAGAYTVRTVSGSPAILLFENDTTKMKALAFARIFHDAAGRSPIGFSIKAGAQTYEMSMSSSSSPLKGALLALTPAK